jgi:hypothetical protein
MKEVGKCLVQQSDGVTKVCCNAECLYKRSSLSLAKNFENDDFRENQSV